MKLNIVPARTGLVWVKLGITTFFRQPLAFAGLFFMFMALMSVATLVPFVGSALALTLLPAATLGLMAATLEASKGKFPMPTILISAFRAGRERMRAMLTLGAFYAVGFLAIMGISTLLTAASLPVSICWAARSRRNWSRWQRPSTSTSTSKKAWRS